MPASPRDQPRHVVAANLGQELVLAKELDQQREPMLGAVGTRVMLPALTPIPPRHIVEAQRGARGRGLRNVLLGPFALGGLYFFRVPPSRAFGRAVKAMTSDLEVEVPIWRARAAIERHAGESLR